MSVAVALTAGRRAAEARMGAANGGSDVTVRRAAGLAPQNPTTGAQARAWTVVYADLPVRLAAGGWGATPSRTLSVPTGDTTVPVRTMSAAWDKTDFQDGDLIEVTAGDCAGQVLQIVDAAQADQRTAYRIPVIGARRPSEWDEEES